ncbi:hypothetical protein PanWU01x14_303800 [Parasponia andersonii]|uniref:Uncharacterized protein n=1 Tax=Parasponia andersonii TaxID=3476 RepID=A0A2P5ASS9_PARAD|nr:hypothetical protein PanWU01x14_303800 [Parasponia andersonii]
MDWNVVDPERENITSENIMRSTVFITVQSEKRSSSCLVGILLDWNTKRTDKDPYSGSKVERRRML